MLHFASLVFIGVVSFYFLFFMIYWSLLFTYSYPWLLHGAIMSHKHMYTPSFVSYLCSYVDYLERIRMSAVGGVISWNKNT